MDKRPRLLTSMYSGLSTPCRTRPSANSPDARQVGEPGAPGYSHSCKAIPCGRGRIPAAAATGGPPTSARLAITASTAPANRVIVASLWAESSDGSARLANDNHRSVVAQPPCLNEGTRRWLACTGLHERHPGRHQLAIATGE